MEAPPLATPRALPKTAPQVWPPGLAEPAARERALPELQTEPGLQMEQA